MAMAVSPSHLATPAQPSQVRGPSTSSRPRVVAVGTRRRRTERLMVRASRDLGGECGARDPLPEELESNFGENSLGFSSTDHQILVPTLAVLSLCEESIKPLPKDAVPFSESEAEALLRKVVGWRLINQDSSEPLKLQCDWNLKDSDSVTELYSRIGKVADAENYQPEVQTLENNKVRVEVWTSSIGGLSENDFIFASKLDRVETKDLSKKSPGKVRRRSLWVPEEAPMNCLQDDLASGQEWWPFGSSNFSQPTTRKIPSNRWTSTFESVFADGGISVRVSHDPSDSFTAEDDENEAASRDSRTRDNSAGSQEVGIEEPELQDVVGVPLAVLPKLSGENDEVRANPAQLPSSSPSPSSPVMEKIAQVLAVSPESTYSLVKPDLANSDVQREMPMAEERDLRHSTPTVNDFVQEDLSFRRWESQDEQDSGFLADTSPRHGSPSSNGGRDVEIVKKQSPPREEALVTLRTLDLRSRRKGATTTPSKVEIDSEQDYSSPSSFTCGLSPTSLFSDDQEPFRLSISSSDDSMFPSFQLFRSCGGSREEIRMGFRKSPRSVLSQEPDDISQETSRGCVDRTGFRKSPRSVLSQEPDEISQETSDSSETVALKHPQKQYQIPLSCKYLYNDESSDLESPTHAKFRHQFHQPFPAFTYSVGKDMESTSSSSSEADEDDWGVAGSLSELGLFQEANHWEPWLVQDGGVSYDSEDLEFLLSPESKRKGTAKIVPVPEETPPLQVRNVLSIFLQSRASEDMPVTTNGMTDQDSPKYKHDSPKTQQNSPKSQHGIPKPQFVSPKTKRDSPKTQRESATSKHGSPKSQQVNAMSKHDSPKSKQASSKTQYDNPETQPDSPKPMRDVLNIQNDSPKTGHESPRIKHDSLRRPTSENKWVPYVTSSLHGNNPPRVRNPTRRGLQPHNTNVDKTIYQDKVSVTKPSTDKTPKRTVNFAPDLVREIPDSQSQTPAPAPAAPTQERKQQQYPAATRATLNVKKTKNEAVDTTPSLAGASQAKSKKAWEFPSNGAEDEEGPSIMNSRRRWRRTRDGEAGDSQAKPSPWGPGGGGSTSWSFSESRFFRNRDPRRGMPSCVGKLMSWPRRFAGQVKSSRNVDSDDDERRERSWGGDRSFGSSSRRDAEVVRRILRGSHKKYSDSTEGDILKEPFG